MKKLQAVVMDLDDTLYDATGAYQRALRRMAQESSLGEAAFLSAYAEGRARTKEILSRGAGLHNRMLYFQHALESLDRSPLPVAMELGETYWKYVLETAQLYPGVDSFLQRLRRTGMRTAILTDLTVDIQIRKIEHLGISSLIDCLVTSEEVGEEKPSAAMFQLVLEKLGVSPGRCVMLGDSYEKDIEGAGAAGMHTVWKTDAARHGQHAAQAWFERFDDGRLDAFCGLA